MNLRPIKHLSYNNYNKTIQMKQNQTIPRNNVSFKKKVHDNDDGCGLANIGAFVLFGIPLCIGAHDWVNNKLNEQEHIKTKQHFQDSINQDKIKIIPLAEQYALLQTMNTKSGDESNITPYSSLVTPDQRIIVNQSNPNQTLQQLSSTRFVDANGDSYTIHRAENGDFKIQIDTRIKNDPTIIEHHFFANGTEDTSKYHKDIKMSQQKANASNVVHELQSYQDFRGIDTDAFINISTRIGLSNLEIVNVTDSIYDLFVDTQRNTYNVKFKKLDGQNSFVGTAAKLNKDGESELYLFKMDFISTNNSDKIRISHMNIVQDGIEDDSPTSKKGISSTRGTGRELATGNYDGNGKSRWRLFGENYDGQITSETAKEIDEYISLSNADGKNVVVYSCPKGCYDVNKISVVGDSIK